MTAKEYNERYYPLINNVSIVLHALEHNIKKANSPEDALGNLEMLGWNNELKEFIGNAVDFYRKHLLEQVERY